jgi:hypothetical protein
MHPCSCWRTRPSTAWNSSSTAAGTAGREWQRAWAGADRRASGRCRLHSARSRTLGCARSRARRTARRLAPARGIKRWR